MKPSQKNPINAKNSSQHFFLPPPKNGDDKKDGSYEKRVGNSAEKLERHGLFLHEKKDSAEKQNEFTRTIPEEFGLGEAKGKGDCFYDSCAQELNELSGREEYTIKSLRLLCHEYTVALDKHCGGNPKHDP